MVVGVWHSGGIVLCVCCSGSLFLSGGIVARPGSVLHRRLNSSVPSRRRVFFPAILSCFRSLASAFHSAWSCSHDVKLHSPVVSSITLPCRCLLVVPLFHFFHIPTRSAGGVTNLSSTGCLIHDIEVSSTRLPLQILKISLVVERGDRYQPFGASLGWTER